MTALRADGLLHARGLVFTQPITPNPVTRPERSHFLGLLATSRLLKKDLGLIEDFEILLSAADGPVYREF